MEDSGRDEQGGLADAPPAGEGAGRAPWLRFALIFGALAVSSEVAYYGLILDSEVFQSYLRILASASGWILGLFTDGVTVHGAQMSGLGFAVEVAHGCDAIQVCALLVAAVIAFPAPLGHKLKGIVAGVAILQFLNLLRIMSLFLIGARYSHVFQTTHEVIWPTLLIIATIATWIVWVRQEARLEPRLAESG